MAVQIFTHSETELSNIVTVAVNKAIKEYQAQQKPDNTILTQTEAAQLLSISLPTLLKWKEKKLLPYTQIDRKIFFKKQDILNALETLGNKRKG